MNHEISERAGFGWSNFYQSQLTSNDDGLIPLRVTAAHRNGLDVEGPEGSRRVLLPRIDEDDPESHATVGDWVLVDGETGRAARVLDRRSLFKRKAAGTGRRIQLIAANVDTLLIVSSCNRDFNPARIERYLVLAREAGVMPVVVLTKADLAEETNSYRRTAEQLMPGLLVETIDARDPNEAKALSAWCGPGQTVALVGSSGVGKSTLVNTLSGGASDLATGAAREDDDRGRHTTTGRSLHRLPAGGWLLDTPGMRELQIVGAGSGVADLFSDIVEISRNCRFSDCRHETEPGCAVRAAIESCDLDPDRLKRFRKLANEELRNSSTIAERRARDRSFGKMVRSIVKEKEGRWD